MILNESGNIIECEKSPQWLKITENLKTAHEALKGWVETA
jgi:predicted aldo/keto reductase-like oxidoreductase